MRKSRISETMQYIDSKFVDEANEYRTSNKPSRHSIWRKWGTVAACLCLVVAAIITVPNIIDGDAEKKGSMIVNFKTTTDSSYAVPAPGEYFCFTEVNEARKEYAGKDVTFLLAFDVFKGDGETMTMEELRDEYQRLADLGYRLYYVEDHWTYYGKGEKKYIPVVVGLFTEEELSDFKVNEKYGYAFHFETNGDSSPISIDEENVVTNFNSIMY